MNEHTCEKFKMLPEGFREQLATARTEAAREMREAAARECERTETVQRAWQRQASEPWTVHGQFGGPATKQYYTAVMVPNNGQCAARIRALPLPSDDGGKAG